MSIAARLVALLALSLLLASCQTFEGRVGDELSEQEFVTHATSASLFEIRSSELALQKTIPLETERFARQTLTDYRRIENELSSIARRTGLRTTDSLLARHRERLEELEGLEGNAFAERYHTLQVRTLTELSDLYNRAERELNPEELRTFAARVEEVVEAQRRALATHEHG